MTDGNDTHETRITHVEADVREIKDWLAELTRTTERVANVIEKQNDHEKRIRHLEHGQVERRAEGHSISNLENRVDQMEAHKNRMEPVASWLAKVAALVLAAGGGAVITHLMGN